MKGFQNISVVCKVKQSETEKQTSQFRQVESQALRLLIPPNENNVYCVFSVK